MPPPSEAQREAILGDLDCPIMSAASNAQIAAEQGVNVALVRELRRLRREDLWTPMVRLRAEELARMLAHDGDMGALLVLALEVAIARLDPERFKDSGARRSADEATVSVQRSRAPAEAHEGVSGDRDPRRATPRGAAWGRDRSGRGSSAVTEKREG